MIELIGLCGGYHGESCVKNITAEFRRGSITSILGLNGHGKSTLVRLACGQLAPYRGEILVDGKAAGSIPREVLARKISYLPQFRNTPNITAGTLVMHGRFPYLGYPRIYREEDRLAAEAAMKAAGIFPLRESYLSELSGGERQKAYMAMILAQDADAVFLDEPTTFLDIAHQLEIMGLIRRLRDRGKAVVMVSHDINRALVCSDMLLLLREGELARLAPPDEVLASGLLEEIFAVRISACRDPNGETQYIFTRPSAD